MRKDNVKKYDVAVCGGGFAGISAPNYPFSLDPVSKGRPSARCFPVTTTKPSSRWAGILSLCAAPVV